MSEKRALHRAGSTVRERELANETDFSPLTLEVFAFEHNNVSEKMVGAMVLSRYVRMIQWAKPP